MSSYFYYRVINLNGNHLQMIVRCYYQAISIITKRHPKLAKTGKISYVDMSQFKNMSVVHVKAGCKWYAIIEKSYTLHGP